MEFFHQYNYKRVPGEVNDLASMTVPGMAYKMSELLSMYTKPDINLNLPYTDEELPLSVDLTDLEDLKRHIDITQESLKKTPVKADTPPDPPQ